MLFEKERLTLAQASRMAEMNRLEFQHLLAGRGIPDHYDGEERDLSYDMLHHQSEPIETKTA